MRKSGKYEKQPEVVVTKQPKVKSALLQTYLVSLLCMVLCVTMFFGTSFAWFTSEVNNNNNEIYIGTLDVGLFKQVTADGTTKLENLADTNYTLFDKNVRWEPGYTALETIQVVNEGDLAFKYVLSFTDGKLTDAEAYSLAEAAKCFDVWVYDYYDNDQNAPVYNSYADISTEKKWYYIGSLADVLDGKAVITGNMDTVRQDDKSDDPTTGNGTQDGVKTIDTYTIALHMKEDTKDAKLMGGKISLTVKLVAYQKAQEVDAFGKPGYDNLTGAGTVTALKDALATTNGDVLLASDIDIQELADTLFMTNTVVLDGNGKKISYSGGRTANNGSVGVLTTSGGTIRNITVDGRDNGRALYVTELKSDLYVSGSVFAGAYSFNVNSAVKTDYIMKFTNTAFQSWTSYANVMKHAYFNGCTFNDTLKPYGDTTLTGCTFAVQKLDVSALEEGETITLENCNYGGVFIEKAVLKAEKDTEGKLVVTCDNALLKIQDGNVVLDASGQN